MVPIIALSANAYQEDIEKALAAGINDYIVKPVVPGLLYHVLASWIGSSRQPAEGSSRSGLAGTGAKNFQFIKTSGRGRP